MKKKKKKFNPKKYIPDLDIYFRWVKGHWVVVKNAESVKRIEKALHG